MRSLREELRGVFSGEANFGQRSGSAKIWPATGRGRMEPCRGVATARTLQQEPSSCSQSSRRDPEQGHRRWAPRGWTRARPHWVSAYGEEFKFYLKFSFLEGSGRKIGSGFHF